MGDAYGAALEELINKLSISGVDQERPNDANTPSEPLPRRREPENQVSRPAGRSPSTPGAWRGRNSQSYRSTAHGRGHYLQARPSQSSSQPGSAPIPKVPYDLQARGNRLPILLFDLNGTITSHTSMRRSAGRNEMRPGIHHLRRLKGKFRLGIYSSATVMTVSQVIPMLEEAAGAGEALFTELLVLHRAHTRIAPQEHRSAGGKAWDTVKPLACYFSKLDRVLLVDDDAYKATKGEESNMVLMPCWNEEPDDTCIEQLVNALLNITDGMSETTDLRHYSQAVSNSISKPANAGSSSQEQPHWDRQGGGLRFGKLGRVSQVPSR